jgi:hypothetical protein
MGEKGEGTLGKSFTTRFGSEGERERKEIRKRKNGSG